MASISPKFCQDMHTNKEDMYTVFAAQHLVVSEVQGHLEGVDGPQRRVVGPLEARRVGAHLRHLVRARPPAPRSFSQALKCLCKTSQNFWDFRSILGPKKGLTRDLV